MLGISTWFACMESQKASTGWRLLAMAGLAATNTYKRFLRRYSAKPAEVSLASSRNKAESGPVKLKQESPCMRFLSSADTLLRNDSSQYSGIRWKLTYVLPEITAPKKSGLPL